MSRSGTVCDGSISISSFLPVRVFMETFICYVCDVRIWEVMNVYELGKKGEKRKTRGRKTAG